jgi:hypothetical protein
MVRRKNMQSRIAQNFDEGGVSEKFVYTDSIPFFAQ